MLPSDPTPSPSLLKVVAAFAAIYLIWGSTYLAIAIAIETMPPFLMAGVRFLAAGSIVYVWARWGRGAERPTGRQWRSALIIGGLLLLGGNGGVVWSEQRVASSIAALTVALVPIWMVLINWIRPGGRRPAAADFLGVALGFIGLIILVDPRGALQTARVDRLGIAALIGATLSWSMGSVFAHHVERPQSPLISVGMEMLCGGGLLLAVGLLTGEGARVDLAGVSLRSALALLYLLVFGSIVAFTAYMWLLRVSTPSRVATYAYVNPVVAVVLGWGLGNEVVTSAMISAMVVILSGVILINTLGSRARGPSHK